VRLGIGLKVLASSWQGQSNADYLLTEHSCNNIQDFLSTTQAVVHSYKQERKTVVTGFWKITHMGANDTVNI